MSEARKKADWPVVAALVLAVALLVLPAMYVGGYFAFSNCDDHPIATVRIFWNRKLEEFYTPLAPVEEFLTGREVILGYSVAVP